MTKSYRFIDSTNQFAKSTDDKGNCCYFMINDDSNDAQREWASTVPLPEIELFSE